MREYHYYNPLLQGDGGALKRALYKSMGFTDEALEKPLIGVVNTYTNATPGHFNLNELCTQAVRGVEAAGGTAMTFGTIAPCDGIAEGHEGMRYIGDCLNVTGRTVSETLRDCGGSVRPEVIRGLDGPFASTGGVAVLRGNLAPLGAVAKPAAIPEPLMCVRGRAQIFHSEQEACEGILKGRVEPGRVIVLRYEGPKGGPGMPEMYRPMKCLEGMGLSERCALITDGRFSGSNRGCFVGHISPEAYEGGVLALAEDGDEILIDVPGRRLELLVDEETLERRRRVWTRPEKELPDGYLKVYRALSRSAAQGAVLDAEGGQRKC